MRIRGLIWNENNTVHLWNAHRVTPEEVEDVIAGTDDEPPRYVIIRDGPNYRIMGRTGAGRLLAIIGEPLGGGRFRVFGARDMTSREKRTYRSRELI